VNTSWRSPDCRDPEIACTSTAQIAEYGVRFTITP
jgi:hypothetical protein